MNLNLVKWTPSVELEDVANRLNRIFGRARTSDESAHDLLAMTDWTPSVDISETDTSYVLKAEIPGVNKEDVKVTIQDGLLGIQGERKQEKEEKGKKFHRIERYYGSFARSFRVPDDADENSVKAEFKNGMLNIRMDKHEKAKPKQINVSVS
jgi:HSP20 family protein